MSRMLLTRPPPYPLPLTFVHPYNNDRCLFPITIAPPPPITMVIRGHTSTCEQTGAPVTIKDWFREVYYECEGGYTSTVHPA